MLSGYSYFKIVTIAGQTGAGTNYQVKLRIGASSSAVGADFHVEGHCTDFPNDIKFTSNDGSTLLSYWIEKIVGTGANAIAEVWIKVANSLETDQDIYCFYDKTGDTSASNGVNTFLFFDDFEALTLGSINGQNGWSSTEEADIILETTKKLSLIGSRYYARHAKRSYSFDRSQEVIFTGFGWGTGDKLWLSLDGGTPNVSSYTYSINENIIYKFDSGGHSTILASGASVINHTDLFTLKCGWFSTNSLQLKAFKNDDISPSSTLNATDTDYPSQSVVTIGIWISIWWAGWRINQVFIKKRITTEPLFSSASIEYTVSTIQQTISSSSTIKVIGVQQTIVSNSIIKQNNIQETIDSDAVIKRTEQSEIDSDSKVVYRIQKTISSDAFISYYKDFIFKHQIYSETQKDFNLRLKIQYPTPTNPTDLTVEDLKTGEALYLTWTGTNYGWNVYKDVGGSWIKQNLTLITENNYTIGGLTNGVTYLFKVSGVNGYGDESSGVTNSGTPTFDIARYLKPNWNIYIGGVEQTDAILESVELVYGPNLSSASFFIPKNPTTPGLPDAAQQLVQVYINNKKVFTGYLMKRENIINSGNLRVNYIAVSILWDYTRETVNKNYNIQYKGHIKSTTVGEVLRLSQCPSGVPAGKFIYGEINAADLTKLELMSSMLRYVGNYKIYCSPSGGVSYYKVGAPLTFRTYEVGKHILNSSINKNISDKIDQVTVYSGYSDITTYRAYYSTGKIWLFDDEIGNLDYLNSSLTRDSSGNFYIEKQIFGWNISNVSVEANVNSKPVALSIIDGLQVTPSHCGLTKWPDGSTNGKFGVYQYQTCSPTWQSVSAEVTYDPWFGSWAKIKIPVPVKYVANIKKYTARFKKAGSSDVVLPIRILEEPIEYIADIRIIYSYQSSMQQKTIGSGTIKRTLHDSVTPYSINTPTYHDSNMSVVYNYISDRAQVEYDKLSKPSEGGSLSVLGDETIDLRTQVNGLEVMRVVHDFSNGFITNLDLTNESFYHGEAVMVQYNKEAIKIKTNKIESEITTIDYNLGQLKKISGFLGLPTTSIPPKSGVGIYSD